MVFDKRHSVALKENFEREPLFLKGFHLFELNDGFQFLSHHSTLGMCSTAVDFCHRVLAAARR